MSTVQHLLERALYSPSFWHSRAAARSLEQLRQPVAAIQGPLAEALRHADEKIRRRAVRLLRMVPLPAATTASFLRRALKDVAWTVRRAAVQGLAACGAAASVTLPDLVGALGDEVSGVREAAVEAVEVASFAGISGTEVGTALLDRLTDTDESVREAAARALVRLRTDSAQTIPALAAALSDESAAVRALAARALASLGSEAQTAEPALLGRLDDPASVVRREVVATLGQRGTERAVPVLVRLLEGELREEAARALGQLGRRLPHLEELLLSAFRSGRSALRTGALRALACLDSAAALVECRQLCREANLHERRRAVRALGWFGARTADVLPELEAALRDSHGKVRKAAAESLAALGGRAAPALAGLLRRLHDCDGRVRAACAAAVARILPELPACAQSWLRVLADPRHGPGHNLRQGLARLEVPESVRAAFHAACVRRAAWHSAPTGETAPPSSSPSSPWQAARVAARQAGRKAARKCPSPEQPAADRAARTAEHAWQLAYLWSLLFPSLIPNCGASLPRL